MENINEVKFGVDSLKTLVQGLTVLPEVRGQGSEELVGRVGWLVLEEVLEHSGLLHLCVLKGPQ